MLKLYAAASTPVLVLLLGYARWWLIPFRLQDVLLHVSMSIVCRLIYFSMYCLRVLPTLKLNSQVVGETWLATGLRVCCAWAAKLPFSAPFTGSPAHRSVRTHVSVWPAPLRFRSARMHRLHVRLCVKTLKERENFGEGAFCSFSEVAISSRCFFA